MPVTGCANCAEMDEECVTLQDELREQQEEHAQAIQGLELNLAEIREAIGFIKGYIEDIERELP